MITWPRDMEMTGPFGLPHCHGMGADTASASIIGAWVTLRGFGFFHSHSLTRGWCSPPGLFLACCQCQSHWSPKYSWNLVLLYQQPSSAWRSTRYQYFSMHASHMSLLRRVDRHGEHWESLAMEIVTLPTVAMDWSISDSERLSQYQNGCANWLEQKPNIICADRSVCLSIYKSIHVCVWLVSPSSCSWWGGGPSSHW